MQGIGTSIFQLAEQLASDGRHGGLAMASIDCISGPGS
jgi:hypothetical protein